jgi:hypothetical protein
MVDSRQNAEPLGIEKGLEETMHFRQQADGIAVATDQELGVRAIPSKAKMGHFKWRGYANEPFHPVVLRTDRKPRYDPKVIPAAKIGGLFLVSPK